MSRDVKRDKKIECWKRITNLEPVQFKSERRQKGEEGAGNLERRKTRKEEMKIQ